MLCSRGGCRRRVVRKEWFWKVFERNTGMERFNLDTMIQLENFGDENSDDGYDAHYDGAGDVETMNG